MADWLTEIRYVLRGWRRSPGFSATVVLTLVFGLGLASAIFAFADGYLFRPLPFPGGDRTYFVSEPSEWLHAADTLLLRRSSVRELGFVRWGAGHRVTGREILVDGRPVEFFTYDVSPDFRKTLAIPLIAGRDFTDDDHREGGPVPAWISHRFWTRELGGDPGVIGRAYQMSGRQAQQILVVGVIGPAVTSFDPDNRPPDAVVPEVPPATVGPNLYSHPLVRLPEGMSQEQATALISSVLNGVAPAADGRVREVRLRSLTELQLRGGKPTARVLFAGAMLVLLLATVNLVHLLLTRGVSRAAEIGTRAALGASAWRLSRLFVTESLMFSALGVAGGLLFGGWMADVIDAAIPRWPTAGRNLALVPTQFDWRVVAFAATLGLVVTLLGGLWPARRALRARLAWGSRSTAGVASAVSVRLSRSILASELAIATVVMVGTLFIGLGIWRYLNQPLGFDTEDRFRVGFESATGDAATPEQFETAIGAIRAVRQIRAAGAYYTWNGGVIEVPERALDPKGVDAVRVTAGYFEAWNLRLRSGRWFSEREFRSAEPLAAVDQSFAALAWPGLDPVGRELRVAAVLRRVVGVIEPKRRSLMYPNPATVYVPIAPAESTWSAVVWAPRASLADLTAAVVSAVHSALPGARVEIEPVTLEALFLREVGEAQFQAPIVFAFGVLAFMLAGIGVFGLVSYLVEQRTREFGLRLALGARPGDVWRSVIRQSISPAIAGLIIGVAGAWALESVVRSSVFGWQSSGSGAISAVAVALLGITVLAAAVPARRAMRIDPAKTLKAE